MDKGMRERIRNEVDAGFDSQIEFLQQLVRLDSTRGNERDVQRFMAEAMRERSLDVDEWQIQETDLAEHPGFSPVTVSYDQAWNVVGTLRPQAESGRSLILNGHVDVVPPGPADMWTDPPFSAVIRDGWMYGRGAGDMKAGVASNLFALDAVRRAGVPLNGRIHVESVVEEESTGNGALACFLRGYKADCLLCPEPTRGSLTRANCGVVWFQVLVRGKPVHVQAATRGANAIAAAFGLMGALKGLETEWNNRRVGHALFKELDHPIHFNVGKIEGGDWASSVPAWCRFDMRASYYPGIRPEEAVKEIQSCIAAAAEGNDFLRENPPVVTVNGFHTAGYALAPGSEAERMLAESHVAEFGEPMTDRVTPAYLDARVHALYGGVPAMVYGANSENAHGFDERVNLESVRRCTRVLAQFIALWSAGVSPASS